MKAPFQIAALWLSIALALPAFAGSEAVVAIRYLKAEGISHAHLYLFTEGGTLLRQLTNDAQGQDRDPVFSPDGATIVFSREAEKGMEVWSIEPRGAGLAKLGAAPPWYAAAKNSPFYGYPTEGDGGDGDFGRRNIRYKAPDDSVEVVIRELKGDEHDQVDGLGHGAHYLLRDPKTGSEVEFGKIPGFEGVYDLLEEAKDHRRFLLDPPLRIAFFGLHLNSTDGDTVYALDLKERKFVRLSPNWAAPVPLPGEAAFLTFTSVRYVPIPGTRKTANCSYLEHWDASCHKIRYAHEGPAIMYGASMYRSGKTPPVITIRTAGDSSQ